MRRRKLCPKEDLRTGECSYCRYKCLVKAKGNSTKYNELREDEQKVCSKVKAVQTKTGN